MKNLYAKLTQRDDRGFTLIELLVVIAIIAVLAALVLAALSSAQKGSRDAQRRSDLNQYKTALAQYQSDNGGSYVVAVGPVSKDGTGGALAGLSPQYLTSFPKAPQGGQYQYNGTSADFGLCADLERGADDFAVGPTYSGTPKNGATGTACTPQG